MNNNGTARIYFLDHLRTFMVFLVVVIHAGLVYEKALETTWIVVDPLKNDNIGLVRLVLDVFAMFTLFFISGYFIPTSIQNKSIKEFIISKFKRIMIPWIIAVVTLIPLYKIIFLFSRNMPQEEWFSYFHWFSRIEGNPYLFSDNPVQSWLWFLPILFLFQMVYLGMTQLKIKVKISFLTGVILTLILGVIYSMSISLADLTGWYHSTIFHFQKERLLVYFLVFLLGALGQKTKIVENPFKRKSHLILINILLYSALTVYIVTVLNIFFNMIIPEREFYFISSAMDRLVLYTSLMLSMLSFIYIWIDLFKCKFSGTNAFWSELSRNTYYVYVIHMIVIGVFAYPMIGLQMSPVIKYIVLSLVSFAGSHGIVFGVRQLFKSYN